MPRSSHLTRSRGRSGTRVWDKIEGSGAPHATGSSCPGCACASSPSSSIRATTSPSSRRRSSQASTSRSTTAAWCALTGTVTPGHRFATRAIADGDLRAAVRAAHRHLARHRRRRPHHRPQHEQRRAGRPRPARRPAHARARADAGRRAPDLARLSPQGRPRRHAQLPARSSRPACARATSRSRSRRWPSSRIYSREKYPNVDGVVAIPHNKGCGCSDGSNIDVMLRTLSNYATHPNVGGVIFIGLGCEKTNLTAVEKYLQQEHIDLGPPRRPLRHPGHRRHAGGHRPRAAGSGGDAAGDQRDHAHRGRHARAVARREVRRVRRVLGAVGQPGARPRRRPPGGDTAAPCSSPKCRSSAAPSTSSRSAPRIARPAKRSTRWSTGTRNTRRSSAPCSTRIPSPGNVAGGLLNITIKSLGAIAKAGTTRVEGVIGYAEVPKGHGLWLMQGPGYDQESTPGLVAAGAQVVVFTTGRGTTIGNAIAPVVKLASNTGVHARMSRDLDLSAGGIIDGTETIDAGRRARVRPRAARRLGRGAGQGRGDQAPRVRHLGRAIGVALMRAAVLVAPGRMHVRDVPVVAARAQRSAAARRAPSGSAAPTSTSSAGTATTTATPAAAWSRSTSRRRFSDTSLSASSKRPAPASAT